jgi:hypothetical protein
MEPVSTSSGRRYHAAISISGALCAGGMCVGALGPWVRTPVISFTGWAGIGFPLVVLAFVVLALEVLHAFVPRRMWLVLTLLLGALSLVCAIVLALIESLLAHAGSLVALVVARGAHRELFGAGHTVSLAWGIPVLAIMSFLLMLVSVAGLFGRFSVTILPRLHRQSRPFVRPEVRQAISPIDDDELFKTR